jgi:hypothetical protein
VINVYGDVALMRSRWTQTATLDGKPWKGVFLLTDVWARRDHRWQTVARHATPIAGYSVGASPDMTWRLASG